MIRVPKNGHASHAFESSSLTTMMAMWCRAAAFFRVLCCRVRDRKRRGQRPAKAALRSRGDGRSEKERGGGHVFPLTSLSSLLFIANAKEVLQTADRVAKRGEGFQGYTPISFAAKSLNRCRHHDACRRRYPSAESRTRKTEGIRQQLEIMARCWLQQRQQRSRQRLPRSIL